MAERRDIVDLAQCMPLNITMGVFTSRALEEGRTELGFDEWSTSMPSTQGLGDPILRVFDSSGDRALFELDGTLTHVVLTRGRVYAAAAAATADQVATALARLRELLPAPDPSSAHEVTLTFWTYSKHGPQPSWRTIAVPEWAEITENYAATTGAQLAHMMQEFRPAHGGQLILWHGEAGTGKTFALRGLAWEWRAWCDFHYIVDPDSFFGEHADYLMNVLLMPAYNPATHGWSPFGGPLIAQFGGDDESEKPWRVLILEDTGELLTPDAKTMIGQGLSRFLNLVDGLIGQGLRVLVLVTTNEPIRALHPAVARPGRCAANIEFHPLSPEEANNWLERHEHEARVDSPTTLASLYARLEGEEAIAAVQSAGFAGG